MSRTPNFPKPLRRVRLTLSKAASRDSARLDDGTAAGGAATVYQLCNRDFGYVTGTEVFVTGGQHLY